MITFFCSIFGNWEIFFQCCGYKNVNKAIRVHFSFSKHTSNRNFWTISILYVSNEEILSGSEKVKCLSYLLRKTNSFWNFFRAALVREIDWGLGEEDVLAEREAIQLAAGAAVTEESLKRFILLFFLVLAGTTSSGRLLKCQGREIWYDIHWNLFDVKRSTITSTKLRLWTSQLSLKIGWIFGFV